MSEFNSNESRDINSDSRNNQENFEFQQAAGSSAGNPTLFANPQLAMLTFDMSAKYISDLQRAYLHDYKNHDEIGRQLKQAVEDQKEKVRTLFKQQIRCGKCGSGPLDQAGNHANWEPAALVGMVEVQAAYENIENVFASSRFNPIAVSQATMDKVNAMFVQLVVDYNNLHVEDGC